MAWKTARKTNRRMNKTMINKKVRMKKESTDLEEVT
jgi:hypothetical protein